MKKNWIINLALVATMIPSASFAKQAEICEPNKKAALQKELKIYLDLSESLAREHQQTYTNLQVPMQETDRATKYATASALIGITALVGAGIGAAAGATATAEAVKGAGVFLWDGFFGSMANEITALSSTVLAAIPIGALYLAESSAYGFILATADVAAPVSKPLENISIERAIFDNLKNTNTLKALIYDKYRVNELARIKMEQDRQKEIQAVKEHRVLGLTYDLGLSDKEYVFLTAKNEAEQASAYSAQANMLKRSIEAINVGCSGKDQQEEYLYDHESKEDRKDRYMKSVEKGLVAGALALQLMDRAHFKRSEKEKAKEKQKK